MERSYLFKQSVGVAGIYRVIARPHGSAARREIVVFSVYQLQSLDVFAVNIVTGHVLLGYEAVEQRYLSAAGLLVKVYYRDLSEQAVGVARIDRAVSRYHGSAAR